MKATYLTLSFLALTLSIYGEETCCDEPYCPPECPSECLITPPGRPFDPNSWGFYVTIDPLLWHPYLNGASVAIQTENSNEIFSLDGKNRVKNIPFNWDWGFRLGVGYNMCHDGWDLVLRWTRWETSSKLSLTAPTNGALYPTRGIPVFVQNEIAQSLFANWKLDYNILDLENGREFCISHWVTLRPFVGLRSAWIDQTLTTRYFNLAVPNAPVIPENEHSIRQKDRFWGIGIRGGIDTEWGIIGDFSLFSNFAGNLLYAYHSVKQIERPGPGLFTFSDFFHTVTAIFDLQLGIRYDLFFCCDSYHIGFDLGWELHWLPNQNQFFNFVDAVMPGKFTSNEGDLGIQGFYFRARFDF